MHFVWTTRMLSLVYVVRLSEPIVSKFQSKMIDKLDPIPP